MLIAMDTVTGQQLRASVGSFPSGVTVVTGVDSSGRDHGLTVSAFCSLSLEPAMVLVSIDSRSQTLAKLEPGQAVGVSVLSEDQLQIATQFARHVLDRFAGVEVERHGGVAFIAGAAAWFLGTVESWLPGGDHTIITIRVNDCGHDDAVFPLRYMRGKLETWGGGSDSRP